MLFVTLRRRIYVKIQLKVIKYQEFKDCVKKIGNPFKWLEGLGIIKVRESLHIRAIALNHRLTQQKSYIVEYDDCQLLRGQS